MSLYQKIKWKLQTQVIRKIQRVHREKWWVRALTLILVLAGPVLLGDYIRRKLSNIPWAVNIEAPSPFAPASAGFRRQELVIEGPNLSTGSLLTYPGGQNEVVDVHCASGHLDADTIEMFQAAGADPLPPGDHRIDFVWQPGGDFAKRLSDDEDTCTTLLSVALAPSSKPPTKIHFFQSYELGSDQQRFLEMMVDAELVVSVDIMPPAGKPDDPGCMRLIKVGSKWELPHDGGVFQVKFIVPVSSNLRFIFKPLDGRSTLPGKDNFKPFGFVDQPLQAQVVSINPLAADGKPAPFSFPISSARADKAESPLAIGNLLVGSEELELSVSGKGLVQTEGEYASNFLDHANKEVKTVALLLVMINTAFLGWWLRQAYRLFSRRP